MYDETQLRIIDATMTLIIDKGYSGATTKDIAKAAGVNESTILDRKSTRLNSSHIPLSRMPSSA